MFVELIDTLKQLGSPRILVVGDVMIDHFIWGSVQRISPEAPTPVLSYGDERLQLGGAGFTVAVLADLGAKVDLAAVCGEDDGRRQLCQLLEDKGVGFEGLVSDPARPTTRKQRLIARDADLSSGQQQLLRVDFERTENIPAAIEKKFIVWLKANYKNYDAIVASDYSKGFLTDTICAELGEIAKEVPVIGDPAKGVDMTKYRGFTALKPNRHETERITGIKLDSRENIIAAGKKLVKTAELDFTFISLDEQGIFTIDDQDDFVFVPTKPLEVYDVAGAGDSVVSMMALLATSKLPKRYLLEACNAAASIMISQKAPKTISREALIARLGSSDIEGFRRKVRSPEQLAGSLGSIHSRSRQVYFTNGYFDNISPSQILFLEKLGGFDGIRIVAINSDASIRALGHEPRLPQLDRLRLLQMFDCIDYIVIFDENDSSSLIEQLQPDVFLKGANYRDAVITEKVALEKVGTEIQFVDIR